MRAVRVRSRVFPLRVVYLPGRGAGGGCFHSYQCFEAPLQTCGEAQPRKASDPREAYRVNKHELLNALAEKKCRLAIAFIYLSDQLTESSVIEERVKTALARIVEKVTVSDANVVAVAPLKP